MTEQIKEVKEIESKQLTFEQVKLQAEQNNEIEQYQLDDTTHFSFQPIFNHTKLQEMFDNISKILPQESDDISDKVMQNFVLFHLIKTFTQLGEQLTADTFSEQLQELDALIDAEYDGKSLFKLIVDEIFLPQEIQKTFNLMYEAMANTEMVKRLTERSLLQLAELDIENKEVLQKLRVN